MSVRGLATRFQLFSPIFVGHGHCLDHTPLARDLGTVVFTSADAFDQTGGE